MKYFLLMLLFIINAFSFSFFSNDKKTDDLIPKSVEFYKLQQKNMEMKNKGRVLLQQFPFISNTPIINFKGKFSDEFYKQQKFIYTFSKLKNVNFLRLKNNPALYNFIYVLPIWIGDFKRVSDDLFTNIAFSSGLTIGEEEILKWWMAQGGILWIENGVYATRYDAFKKNGEIDDAAIRKRIFSKAQNLNFLNKPLDICVYYMAEKHELISYKPLEVEIYAKSDIDYFKDIHNLKTSNYNYLSLYFIPKGISLLKDTKNRTLVSFIPFGKGGIVSLRDFDFQDKKYDGELLRWKLLSFFLNKGYKNLKTKNDTVQNDVDKIIQTKYTKESDSNNNEADLSNNTPLILHFNFAYKSVKLTKRDKFKLKPIIAYMKNHPNAKVKIIGYTDSIGSRHYNELLSLKRALSVRDELVNNGIRSSRFIVEGRGEDSPIASNETEEGRAKNRRVEFILIK